jgi:uncharacterized protein YcbX
MHVSALWRYPVKSLGAEPLRHARLDIDGISGDRIVHVRGAYGPLTGRTRQELVAIPATTGPDGIPRVAGERWNTPAAAAVIRRHAGPDARLAAYHGPERFDVLNLLVATDGAVDAFGHDVRRLRPNLLLDGVPGNAERTWPGHALAIGDALIGIHSMRQRCVVTSIDPDTAQRDPDIYRHIRRSFDGELALNCWIIRPGNISIGDRADLVPTDQQPVHLGGWITGAPYAVAPPT